MNTRTTFSTWSHQWMQCIHLNTCHTWAHWGVKWMQCHIIIVPWPIRTPSRSIVSTWRTLVASVRGKFTGVEPSIASSQGCRHSGRSAWRWHCENAVRIQSLVMCSCCCSSYASCCWARSVKDSVWASTSDRRAINCGVASSSCVASSDSSCGAWPMPRAMIYYSF